MTAVRLYRAGVSAVTPPVVDPFDPPPLSLTAIASRERATVTFNGERLATPVWASMNFGYGNLYGGYTFADKDWGNRASDVANGIDTLDGGVVHLFAALELHEENEMHLDFLRRLRLLNGDWSLAEGDGGNHLLYKASMYAVTKAVSMMMPGNRAMSDFTVRDIATGVVFHVIAAHFRANDTNGTSRDAERKQQAAFLAQYAVAVPRAIIAADLNSSTEAAGFPRAILKQAGWRGLRETSTTGVENGTRGTYTQSGGWIEDILTRSDAEVVNAHLIPTEGLSDHYAWLTAQVQVGSVIDTGLKLTLFRESGGRRVQVPGVKNLKAATSVFTDHTVPLNRPVVYVATMSDGSVLTANPITVQAELPLLTHPVTGATAPCTIQTWPEKTHDTPSTIVKVPGRRPRSC